MGIRGQRYFEEANQLGGLVAKMRLASLAQITSAEVSTRTDTADLLQRLEVAFNLVRGEFSAHATKAENTERSALEVGRALPVSPAISGMASASGTSTGEASAAEGSLAKGESTHLRSSSVEAATSKTLRTHMSVLLDLFSQRGLFAGDLEATVRRITESAATTLGIERVSVWFLDGERSTLVCADLFERAPARHSAGTELSARDFPAYFQALVSERTIAAHDAHRDPRTDCFSASYLTPLGIGALLDVPIWLRGNMVGVLCHEHLGATRRWTEDEETFAYFLSNLVTLTLEQRALTHSHEAARPPSPLSATAAGSS